MLKERAEEINNHAQSLRGAQHESSFLYTLDEFEKKRKYNKSGLNEPLLT